MSENKLVLQIRVVDDESQWRISGHLDVGKIKTLIGDLEIIKRKLISDILEAQKDDKKG